MNSQRTATPSHTRRTLLAATIATSLCIAPTTPWAVERVRLFGHHDAAGTWRERPFFRTHHPSTHLRPTPTGTTTVVTSCLDDGSAGTLRVVLAAASDGDLVDLSALACSAITLQAGAIAIAANDINILGPGTLGLGVYGGFSDRVFDHTGTGTLAIEALAVVDGQYSAASGADAKGGCIRSAGSVSLLDAGAVNCYALSTNGGDGVAAGGAVYARSTITLDGSYVANSIAAGFIGRGGGLSAYAVNARDSYVGSYPFGNIAYSSGFVGTFAPHPGGGGGAIYAAAATIDNTIFLGNSTQRFLQPGGAIMLTTGHSTISNSTFFSNQGDGYGGAIFMPQRIAIYGGYQYCGDASIDIRNSTITGNSATAGAGVYAGCALSISNSTIAFNAAIGFVTGRGAGVMFGAATEINSSIIANNSGIGSHPDLDSRGFAGPEALSGHGNLIARPNVAVPRDTIVLTDPMLAPLAANGGLWPTLALQPGSPAIDAGNNLADLPYDQRGTGYARVSGLRADIGAYEVQQDDRIDLFVDSFERR